MALVDKAIAEVQGFDVLKNKIKKLDDSVKKREMLKILRFVSDASVKAARLAAPESKKPHLISGKRKRKLVYPGNLKKSIGKIVGKKGRSRENAVLYVGPRVKGKHDGFYGGFVHGGHDIVDRKTTRTQRKYATRRGFGIKTKVAPNKFMDRAYAITKGESVNKSEKQVADFIQKQINKLSN